jgi:hypothetical protein
MRGLILERPSHYRCRRDCWREAEVVALTADEAAVNVAALFESTLRHWDIGDGFAVGGLWTNEYCIDVAGTFVLPPHHVR